MESEEQWRRGDLHGLNRHPVRIKRSCTLPEEEKNSFVYVLRDVHNTIEEEEEEEKEGKKRIRVKLISKL